MKKLLLFLIVIAIIGGGIVLLRPYESQNAENRQPVSITPQTPPESFAKPDIKTITSLIPQILGAKFSAQTATYTLVNLDQRNGYELIIGAVEHSSAEEAPKTATIQVVTMRDADAGEYERVGKVEYQEALNGIPEIKEIKDITGDGNPEIIASLMYGGASSWAEGILQVHVENKKIAWVQLQDSQGHMRDARFILAGSAGHWNTVHMQDLTEDSVPELIEIFAQRSPFEETQILCETYVYRWDNTVFAFSQELSDKTLAALSPTCEL